MLGSLHTLIGVGPLCNVNCTVTFTRNAVIVHNKPGTFVLTGWSESTGPRLCRISLQPGESNLPSMPNNVKQATLASYSEYDLPSVADLIRYFHKATGCLVRSTWLKSIGAGNYSLWPGITLDNATKYFPSAEATIMRHLVQKRQGVRSNKPKPQPPSSHEEPMPQVRSNELFLQVTPIIEFYTDNTGRFPIHARSVHQYAMIAYHCNANLILAVPFNTRKDSHRLKSYDKIMQCLSDHKLTVDLQILDNESSAEYKWVIKNKWNINYQLVPPNTH